jgi:hypothetical protein
MKWKRTQYFMGTPNEAWWAMLEILKTIPLAALIIENVDQFLIALE